jgi:lipopolysaccharide transport system ATP-binding protein
MSRREIQRKFTDIVTFAEVESFIDTPVKRYSSGMYLRLAFAVAAHLEPEILVVDEVLAVGDAQFQKKCIGKMGDVARGGRTVLFVSHNMGAVNMLCDRVVYLAQGQVRAVGDTASIVAGYLKEVTENPDVDLSYLRLPGMGQEIRFTRIQLPEVNETNIPFGRPLHFELEAVSDELDVDGLTIGASIWSNTGVCVGTLFSPPFSIRARQPVRLSLTVAHTSLAPGSYYAGFSIGRGGRTTARRDFDIVIGAPGFQVLPVADGCAALANWHPNWGHILFEDVDLAVNEA